MRWVLVVALAWLAGCQAVKPVDEMSFTELQALRAELVKRCTEQGAPPGSPNHRPCMEVEVPREIASRERQNARQRQAIKAMGNALGDYSRQQQAQANRRMNCTSNAIGSTVYTNCY